MTILVITGQVASCSWVMQPVAAQIPWCDICPLRDMVKKDDEWRKIMRERDPEIVSASEIASWAWCPESWRLAALGHKPGNQAALKRGEKRHTRTALFERWSVLAIKIGIWLVVVASLLAALAFVLVRG